MTAWSCHHCPSQQPGQELGERPPVPLLQVHQLIRFHVSDLDRDFRQLSHLPGPGQARSEPDKRRCASRQVSNRRELPPADVGTGTMPTRRGLASGWCWGDRFPADACLNLCWRRRELGFITCTAPPGACRPGQARSAAGLTVCRQAVAQVF
jgi:hypothetical protein